MVDNSRLSKALRTLLAQERIIARSKVPDRYRFDALRPYRPYPGLRRRGYAPNFLVRPETAAEVAGVLRIARRFRVPVVAYGGGTGLMGAAIAVRGGVMIDTTMLNRIQTAPREDMAFRAESGVVLEDAFLRMDHEDLFFAHDPWTRPVATIGGATSTNSLGYLGAKYGSFGAQVLGLEVVLPNGKLLKTRPAQFSSTGFDLKRLFVGTEGLFGVVTAAVVRAFPKPESLKLTGYGFRSFEHAHRAISRMRLDGVTAAMIDYGEEPNSNEDSQLNLAFVGLDAETSTQTEKAELVIAEVGGHRLDDRDARKFWEHRHDIALMFKRRVSGQVHDEDPETKYDYVHVSLPASKVLGFRGSLLEIAKEGGVNVLEVGLWQGPELLSLVLSARASDPKKAAWRLWRASNLIIRQAQDLGGAMEFCHGVGMKLAHLMEREHGVGLEVMRKLKRSIDPLDIMNPEKEGLELER